MNKLHTYAFYALVTPAITFSSAAVLAQQPAGQDADREQQREQQSTQSDRGATPSAADRERQSTQRDQRADRAGQSDAQTAAERRNQREDSRMEHRGYMNSAPMNGLQLSDLMEAEVTTTGDEDVGSVDDLIINEDGQVVAIVVGVGGFLGMGQKDVAIGWDDVTRSGASDELELRIDATREELRSAPEFEREE